MAEAAGWTRTQRRLHATSAVLVGLTFVLGLVMVTRPLDSLLLTFLLYQAHKTFGLMVLILLVWRVAERLRVGRPAWDAMPVWERRAAAWVQGMLLVLLGVVPVLGYLAAATAPGGVPTLFLGVVPVPGVVGPNPAWFGVLRPIHRALAYALIALATLHAAAAIRHHLLRHRTLGIG